jgi:hypothetical protein
VAKRGKKVGKEHYDFKYRQQFEQLMKPDKSATQPKFLGFKLKNINQLWRWDGNLEDVK